MTFHLPLFSHFFSSRDSTQVNCVDLGESFPTSIYLQNLTSGQGHLVARGYLGLFSFFFELKISVESPYSIYSTSWIRGELFFRSRARAWVFSSGKRTERSCLLASVQPRTSPAKSVRSPRAGPRGTLWTSSARVPPSPGGRGGGSWTVRGYACSKSKSNIFTM